MRATNIVLAVAIALVMGALLVLFVRVESTPEIAAPKDELAAAMRRYDRNQAMKTATGSRLRQLQAEAQAEEMDGPPPVLAKDWRAEPAKAHDLHDGVTSTDMVARLDKAQTLYRERKYREAMELSIKLLDEVPDNKQLKRIIVRSACIEKDRDTAARYMGQLSERDQEFLHSHCKRYGVDM